MLSLLNINNLKTIAIVMLIVMSVWLYKDYGFQKSENIRQTENNRQLRKFDSTKYSQEILNLKEFREVVDGDVKLKKILDENNIKIRNLTRIIRQSTKYNDNKNRETNLQPIIKAIVNDYPEKMEIIDSTSCLIIRGNIEYKNDSLKLNITERGYNDESEIIGHLQRRKRKILFWNTRFLGRRQAEVKVINQCGNVTTKIIERKKE